MPRNPGNQQPPMASNVPKIKLHPVEYPPTSQEVRLFIQLLAQIVERQLKEQAHHAQQE
jgi:hypothetical protein